MSYKPHAMAERSDRFIALDKPINGRTKTRPKTQKGKATETNPRSWSVAWCWGKLSVQKIFTLGFWRRDKVLALRRNKNITWLLFCRMKGENLVEGENLSKYKINKLQHGKCFVQYLCAYFCIRKLTHSLHSVIHFDTLTNNWYINPTYAYFPWNNPVI